MSIDLTLLAKTERIIFFDIDCTLTSSVDHFLQPHQKGFVAYKESLMKDWKTIKKFDFCELSFTCLGLFASLLKQTNAKAVCISSWNTNRYDGIFKKELPEAFEQFSAFPKDWFLGFYAGGGGDRYKYTIKPFIKEYNFTGQYIALDDGGFEYGNQNKVVTVRGQKGFDIDDYTKALSLFGIDDKPLILSAENYEPMR